MNARMPMTPLDQRLDATPPEVWESLTKAIDGLLQFWLDDQGETRRERLEAFARRLLD